MQAPGARRHRSPLYTSHTAHIHVEIHEYRYMQTCSHMNMERGERGWWATLGQLQHCVMHEERPTRKIQRALFPRWIVISDWRRTPGSTPLLINLEPFVSLPAVAGHSDTGYSRQPDNLPGRRLVPSYGLHSRLVMGIERTFCFHRNVNASMEFRRRSICHHTVHNDTYRGAYFHYESETRIWTDGGGFRYSGRGQKYWRKRLSYLEKWSPIPACNDVGD